jgi:hypothetical protein
MTPDTCPCCGADVPPNAKACPGCGADGETGWSEEAYTANLDLPDDSFDYDEFVDREFGGPKVRPHGVKWYWWLVAIGIVAVFIFGLLRLR